MGRMFDIARVEVYDVRTGDTVASVPTEGEARAYIAAQPFARVGEYLGYQIIGKVAR